MEYQIVNGKRQTSKLLYIIEEKQLYQVKSKRDSKVYCICYKKNNCKSRVVLNNGLCEKIKNTPQHNHSENAEALYNELKVLNKIKEECVAASGVIGDVNAISGIRSAFRNVVRK